VIKISPSILSSDFGRMGEEVEALCRAGADYVHVDVMDGHFVPNLTIGPPVVEVVKAHSDLPLDVHLMISNPDQYLDIYAKAGADLIGVHVEACNHLNRTIQRIKELDKKACAVLNPHTPLHSLEYVLDMLDMVLLMSVNPGFGGQKYIQANNRKTTQLRKMIQDQGLKVDIEVDGGITAQSIATVAKAGANVFVSGTGVFKHPEGYAQAITQMRRAAEEAIA
jgi:ribulose-phosphate 3-epimerase